MTSHTLSSHRSTTAAREVVRGAGAAPVGGAPHPPLGSLELDDDARCSFGLCRELGEHERPVELDGVVAVASLCSRHVGMGPAMPGALSPSVFGRV